MDHARQPSVRHFDHCPWLFAEEATEEQRIAQREVQRALGGDTGIGERCYVAESAAVFPDRLRLGADSYIAAHAYVTGELTTGSDCTLNPFTTVRGNVVLGDGVRIGAHTSLLGFNHSMTPDRPVFRQPLTSRGIRVGDDVWIGSHVIVVDGVTIGDHCVIGAGAVVTRDLPAWSVAAGNPARVLRDRREGRAAGEAVTTDTGASGAAAAGAEARTAALASGTGAGGDPTTATDPATGPATDPTAAPGTAADAPARAQRAARATGTRAAAPGIRPDGERTPPPHPATTSDRDSAPAAPATGTCPARAEEAAGPALTRPGGGRMPASRAGVRAGGLAAFADAARAQAVELLDRCWDGERYVDRPGVAPTVRAHCDAVEIADLLLGSVPEHLSAQEHIERLSGLQDPKSGLVPEFGEPLPPAEDDGFIGEGAALYHVLCVGYALDLLGPGLPHPVRGVRNMTARQLVVRLESLTWRTAAWGAGAWVDSLATAAHWNLRHGDRGDDAGGTPESLFGWLLTRVDPWTGTWGSPSAEEGRLQVVNGYYRLTRGSFAQFGVPVPYPERVVDSVLDHARDTRHFGPGRENACNVLDVVHPLWLCTRQLGRAADGYRRDEIHDWAERQLAGVLPRWQDGRGLGFGPGTSGPGPEPGLQGTEMWLAITWYLADLLGRSDELVYRPRGIHRPEPARQGIEGPG
ncbi:MULTISPECIES: DapH/DapD/GlmU-related protein [unclassified Streptomyces]|uniref:acyltransferase n=1 Tax=unclassified Streptomyces TaxID=2593676 RepID=UPI002474FB23|nr:MULTISPECIES: DapH/DapD/GlmU-related protein [unclassified Streptomyces]MDH6454593.1 acetyltransferase-like isoleucine patch superfamily enzyme [Streptomyces sp. SAI-119]MDH6494849.1 acetyltransferase-like isoleucine patch superfamily enzyme [Streptomyces sp. SAI-149]